MYKEDISHILKGWKPNLLPNDEAGAVIDWEARLANPEQWFYSSKLDGGRIALPQNGVVKSRELKDISSIHINRMGEDFTLISQHEGIIEGEFYSPEMTFPEIMHFFKTVDVTSDHTCNKYDKLWKKTKGGEVWILKGKEHAAGTLWGSDAEAAIKWTYPGRSVEWLTSWHDSLKFYVFDHVLHANDIRTKQERYEYLVELFANRAIEDGHLILQNSFDHIDNIYQAYDQVMMDGGEGLVVVRKDARYKNGRFTVNAAQGYKIKETNLKFSGVILSVEESTVVREGAEKTVNAFGRSKTSKLKEDRLASGMAKGFKVRMANGVEMTVSLNGFNNEDKIDLWVNPEKWIGRNITFTGMAPVKVGGSPRHAHYTKEY